MAEKFDVVVVGGGPAGSAFAREFSGASKKSVLVLEESKVLGEPNKSTSGFVPKELEDLGVPKAVWGWRTDSVALENKGFSAKMPLEMFVSDYSAVVQEFLSVAEKNGAEVRAGARATAIYGNSVRFVSDGLEREVLAGAIVNSSGPPTGRLSAPKKALPKRRLGLGFDARVEGARLENPREMVFNFDSRFSPGGYSWIFPTSGNTARVGNCWGAETKKKFPGRDLSHKELYALWAAGDFRLSSAKIVRESGGIAYMEDARRRAWGSYVAIGDSASTCRPPFGLGIAPAMKAGVLAAKILAKRGDFSGFDREMNRIERWKPFVNAVSEAFYCLPKRKMDAVLLRLSRIDPEDAGRILALDFKVGKDARLALGLAKDILL